MRNRVTRAGAALVLAVAATTPRYLLAQRLDVQVLLWQVVPQADSFSAKEGKPPVFKAYRHDPVTREPLLIGYAFETNDIPPEVYGYGGPIQVLVGMDLNGTVTGIRVLYYREPIRSDLGDFLQTSGVQEQYRGKHISDPFRIYGDISGIARATISITAMSQGIRSAARRVAGVLAPSALLGPTRPGVTATVMRQMLEDLLFPEMVTIGLVQRMDVHGPGYLGFEVFFTYVGTEPLAQLMLGSGAFAPVVQATRAGNAKHLFLIGLYGSAVHAFDPTGVSIEQDGRTFPVAKDDYYPMGAPSQGKVAQQAFVIGALFLDRAIDLDRPFTISYDTHAPVGVFSAQYRFPQYLAMLDQPPPAAVASVPPAASAAAKSAPVPAAPAPKAAVTSSAVRGRADSALAAAAAVVSQPAKPGGPGQARTQPVAAAQPIAGMTDWIVREESTALSRWWQQIRWVRVGPLLGLLALALFAFLQNGTAARWVVLAATLAYLGFVDGGFLSVTHITGAITVGPSMFLRDLPLLVMIVFAVVTTLLWGRVLCGLLCPFGALQDFLERFVPQRFRWRVPQGIHQPAVYVKYGLLALILVLAVASPALVIYQYVEPFGTIFFLGHSLILWTIAVAILAACAVIPRFYCRYVCPLGAALGLTSLISIFRIKRVDPCASCVICEKSCPTTAIRKERIDFTECVRCGACERKLESRAGVCRKLDRPLPVLTDV
ncbi:MAG: 4Fe-4S binding protein [Gemmatimonadetes bacterium]|nr:4Fe-4S binding protein [Gemmatimonadota bacterium]